MAKVLQIEWLGISCPSHRLVGLLLHYSHSTLQPISFTSKCLLTLCLIPPLQLFVIDHTSSGKHTVPVRRIAEDEEALAFRTITCVSIEIVQLRELTARPVVPEPFIHAATATGLLSAHTNSAWPTSLGNPRGCPSQVYCAHHHCLVEQRADNLQQSELMGNLFLGPNDVFPDPMIRRSYAKLKKLPVETAVAN